MASVLNDAGSSEKITFFIEECKRMGIEVLKPNVNQSDIHFSADKKGQLIFGLSALSGIGEAATQAIVEERKNNGEYKSIFDFVTRVSGRSLSRKTMEVLAKGGGFDCFPDIHRAQYFANEPNTEINFIEKLLKFGQSANAGKDNTMASLFGDMEDIQVKQPVPPVTEKWYRMQELTLEKEVAGFYLSGHPLDDFRFDIDKFTTKSLSHLNNLGELKGPPFTFACIVNNMDHKVSNKDNKPYGNFMLEDYNTQFELRLYGEEYLKFKYFFEKGAMLLVTMSVTENRQKPGLFYKNIQKIELLADVRKNRLKQIKLNILLNDITPNIITELDKLFKENPGEVNVRFNVINIRSGENVELKNKTLNVDVTNDLIRAIERMQSVELIPISG
jgi:DNA polymerase-3 subunit alpha